MLVGAFDAMKSMQKMTPPCAFCNDKLHATLQCKSLMKALKKNPNLKQQGQKEQGQGGNGGGKKRSKKRGGRSGGNGGQSQQDSKKGKMTKQESKY